MTVVMLYTYNESQGQFTDNFKYFCMKMYCQDSFDEGSQYNVFLGKNTESYLELIMNIKI